MRPGCGQCCCREDTDAGGPGAQARQQARAHQDQVFCEAGDLFLQQHAVRARADCRNAVRLRA